MKFQKLLFAAVIVVLAGSLMQVSSAKADGQRVRPRMALRRIANNIWDHYGVRLLKVTMQGSVPLGSTSPARLIQVLM